LKTSFRGPQRFYEPRGSNGSDEGVELCKGIHGGTRGELKPEGRPISIESHRCNTCWAYEHSEGKGKTAAKASTGEHDYERNGEQKTKRIQDGVKDAVRRGKGRGGEKNRRPRRGRKIRVSSGDMCEAMRK